MSIDEKPTYEELEHRVQFLERELQIMKSKLRDGTISESLNSVDVVRSPARESHDATGVSISERVIRAPHLSGFETTY